MKVLCVAEKPSVAKTLSGILAGDQRATNRPGKNKFCRNFDFFYNLPPHGWVDMTITSVLGHLTAVDLPEQYRKWQSCDPVAVFDLPVQVFVADNMKDVAQNLRNEARGAQMLMIWTDCDREGEHIGSEIIQECRKVNRNIQVKRATFSALIANQIHTACQNAGDLDWDAAAAVQARQELDLKVGAAMTRLQTLDLQRRIAQLNGSVISYGPCQFPTLGFVVDRYDRIQNFVPEDFWYIYVLEERRDAPSLPLQKVEFKWKRNHLFDQAVAKILHQRCKDDLNARVTRVISKPTKKFKPYPLTTVELQKSGSRLLRMTPKQVLDYAEKLYQQGYLSYPRTETDQYDPQFDFHTLIRKQTSDGAWGAYAQGLDNGNYERPRNGKKNDKAHPPIHPTAHANNFTSDGEKRVYEYVTRRFLASCSKDAVGTQSTVEIDIAGEEFSAHGLIVQERNYLDVFVYDKWGGSVLPRFEQGETFQPKSCTLKKGATTAPNLLTEADLVSLMDKNGIGTDATIAEHIATVIKREYVVSQKVGQVTYLSPSPLGRGLVEGYNRIDFEKSLCKPIMRRETEYRMNLICQGQRTKDETLTESLAEYKAMFLRARAQFHELASSVANRLNVRVDEARAIAAAVPDGVPVRRPPRGGGGGGGGGGLPPRRRNDDDDDDDDGGTGPGAGGGGGAIGIAGPGPRSAASRHGNAARVVQPAPYDDGNGDDSPDGGSPACGCGQSAVKRTVNKEGANKGRKFWTCGKAQNDETRCGFFDWASDNRGGDLPSSSGSASGVVAPPPGRSNGTRAVHTAATVRTRTAPSAATVGTRTAHTAAHPRWQQQGDEYDDEFSDIIDVDEEELEYGGVDPTTTARPSAVRPPLSPTRQASRAIIDEILRNDDEGGGGGDGEGDDSSVIITSPTHERRQDAIKDYRAWFASLGESDGGGGGSSALAFNNNYGQDDNTRRCNCGLECSLKTVFKEGPNKGRQFYACPKENQSMRCGMFEWADEEGSNSENRNIPTAPWERPRKITTTSRNSSDLCFKCGQGGHWASDCPNDGRPLMVSGHGNRTPSRGHRGGSRGRKRGGTGSTCGTVTRKRVKR